MCCLFLTMYIIVWTFAHDQSAWTTLLRMSVITVQRIVGEAAMQTSVGATWCQSV